MYGSLETIHRGNFVRKCVADAKGKDKEIVSEPNILCEKCAKAFKINQYSGDHYTLPGVIESADNGCHLCILLLNHIPPKNWDQLQLRMKEGFKEPLLTLHVKRQEFVKVQSRSYEQMELRLMEDLGLKKRPPTEILQDQSVEIKYYVELSGFKIDPHKLMPFRFSAMNPAQFGTDSFKLVLGPLQPDSKSSSNPKLGRFSHNHQRFLYVQAASLRRPMNLWHRLLPGSSIARRVIHCVLVN